VAILAATTVRIRAWSLSPVNRLLQNLRAGLCGAEQVRLADRDNLAETAGKGQLFRLPIATHRQKAYEILAASENPSWEDLPIEDQFRRVNPKIVDLGDADVEMIRHTTADAGLSRSRRTAISLKRTLEYSTSHLTESVMPDCSIAT
jgi:hypothetical protein